MKDKSIAWRQKNEPQMDEITGAVTLAPSLKLTTSLTIFAVTVSFERQSLKQV